MRSLFLIAWFCQSIYLFIYHEIQYFSWLSLDASNANVVLNPAKLSMMTRAIKVATKMTGTDCSLLIRFFQQIQGGEKNERLYQKKTGIFQVFFQPPKNLELSGNIYEGSFSLSAKLLGFFQPPGFRRVSQMVRRLEKTQNVKISGFFLATELKNFHFWVFLANLYTKRPPFGR